ncbi:acyl-CoA dehydrogenase family protein [Tomitella biformata]|uniref:acyl-CoA dehydrogenase family protein n=1 Tax=Tomitella biformata TaxID=630403 RepID=UPI0004B8F0E3|nr:acyl-CoA dehydrogenase family protein [Tomitella biformata]
MELASTSVLDAQTGDWRGRLTALLQDYKARPRPATSKARATAAAAWQGELVDAGLAAPGWPVAVGGMALSLEDQLDYYRMTAAAGTPKHPSAMSMIVAPTIIVHGTPAQKDRFLTPLLRADELWCQGFSEPGAGSDLASLSTRAIRDGDVYRVTGQKIWTTKADQADWIFALVRTGPPGRGTAGITYLLIPMDSPGIEVRPLRDAAGGHHFAEVFFDAVDVPVANRIGEEGKGWSIMRTSLGHERATAFLADEFRYRGTVDKVVRLAIERGYGEDPLVRQELARAEASVRAIAANSARALDAVLRGEDPGGVASINRLVKSEFEQRLQSLALRLTGNAAVLGTRSLGVVENGRWTYGYLMSRAATIGAGTAEIQRNTIAEGVLGLPSHRGEGRRAPVAAPGRPLVKPDEDEAALREILGGLLAARVDTEKFLTSESRPGDYDIGLWDQLVMFGLPGLAAPAALGGGDASTRLLCVAVEEAAFHLAPVPLVPTAIALQVLLDAGAEEAARTVIAGCTAAFVAAVDDDGWVRHTGLPVFSDGHLTGGVERVVGAPVADVLVVLAADAATGDLVLATVDPTAATMSVQSPVDLTSTVGLVEFHRAPARPVAVGAVAAQALESARRVARLLVAADSVGVANRALALAVEWAGQREQFGQPIGSYQAISHKCADLLVSAQSARGQVLAAADLAAEDPAAVIAADLASAEALGAGVAVAEGCIQVHGGIGFTWEHPAHLLLRRALSNEASIARPERLRDAAAGALIARVGAKTAGGQDG